MLKTGIILFILAVLAIVAYLPVFNFPFIADDFAQIPHAREYGTVTGWLQLANDPVFRFRATWIFLENGLDRVFGFHPFPFYVANVLLHVLCVWLVFSLGAWEVIGWRVSGVAAAFFAIYEGHQEAVMWVSASMQLLLFLFGILCFLVWILWLQSQRWQLYVAALAAFFVALISMESSWSFIPLMLLPVLRVRAYWRRGILGLIPFSATALACVYWIMHTKAGNPRFGDGSFSLNAPWWVTLTHSYGALLFIWGIIGLTALVYWRAREFRPLSIMALIWMLISLLPYCFLTYMTRVPSRHTYLASLGLAWIVAAAFVKMREKAPRWLLIVVVAVVLLHNIGILWIKKRAQFLEGAAPTQKIMEIADHTQGPVHLHCFPYALIVAEHAVKLTGHELIVDPGSTFGSQCFSVTYKDMQGNVTTYTWKP